MLLFPDRFWWLQRVWGLVLAIGGFIVAIYEFIQAYGAYNAAQIASSGPLDTTLLRDKATILHIQAQEILLYGVMSVVFVGLGILYILKSVDAQRRFRRRLRAIEGDQDAMPRAAIEVDAGLVPNFLDGSLEFLQQASVVDATRYLPSFLGKPYGVRATNDGLWYYSRTGRRQLLRWEEFRLFEVIPPGNGRPSQTYMLYSENAAAVWSNQPPASILLSGSAMQEFEQRHQALLNLIAVRTHLLPRTFDKKLAEDSSLP